MQSTHFELMPRLVSAIGMVVVLLSFDAQAQLTSGQVKILRAALSIGGYLTRDMHREFWGDIPKPGGNREPYLLWIKENFKLSQQYQWEVWKSALASYRRQSVVRTAALAEVEKAIERQVNKPLVFASAPEFAEWAAVWLASLRSNAMSLLRAAATRGSILTDNGKRLYIEDETMILVMLRALHAAFQRGERLLDPEWESRPE